MSLLHKAITLSGACAIGLTLAFAAPAAAEDAKPINFRAVGGAVLGGTWNVGLTGVGKLVNDRYPGSAINVLQGASVSNPLRLEQNAADVTLTQTFNTVAARDGKAPYKKPLKNVASLANMNDTSRLSIIVSADLPVNTFDELMERNCPSASIAGPRAPCTTWSAPCCWPNTGTPTTTSRNGAAHTPPFPPTTAWVCSRTAP